MYLVLIGLALTAITADALSCNSFARVMLMNVSDVEESMLKTVDSRKANFCTKMVFYCSMGNYAVIYGAGEYADEAACHEAGIARFKKELYQMYYKKYDPKQGKVCLGHVSTPEMFDQITRCS